MASQAAFEHLTTARHADDCSLDTEIGTYLKCSFEMANIDEFLQHYIPQQRHIQTFMSMSADLELAEVDTDMMDLQICKPIISISTSTLEEGKRTTAFVSHPNSFSERSVTRCASTKKMPSKDDKVCKRSSSKALKKKLSLEEKADLRREQNREAQRRFREKQMILSWRCLGSQHDPQWPVLNADCLGPNMA